ncbi:MULTISPECIES: type II toxin-antitoxin system RelE/ParE family toxin [unclassified Mucilaginibacter]|uniref:type II toxin-antitoxin system RelE/ParE family toxin n=1 Tax=unclassified Mucilaginibacter TaxID=2617802 RepID=UPI003394AB27
MKVKLLPKAARVLYAIADFVESKNTPGSGARFAVKFKASIDRLAIPNVQYTICSHPKLAALSYSCTNFNDWVIAFKIVNGELIVYEIIHGSLLA